jgi:diguanylate cyclase (GGDEF)-like protein
MSPSAIKVEATMAAQRITARLALLFGLGFAALALIGWQVVSAVDNDAISRQRNHIDNALAMLVDTKGREQEAHAIREEAYRNSTLAVDVDWLENQIGEQMATTLGYSRLYVLDGEDRPVFAFVDGARADPAIFEAVREAFGETLDEVRDRRPMETDKRGHLKRPTLADDGVPVEFRRITHLGTVMGEPAILSATQFTPTVAGRTVREPRAVLLSVLPLHAHTLRQIGRDFDLTGLGWAPDQIPPGFVTHRLRTEEGDDIGTVMWKPDRTGRTILGGVLPWALALLLLFGLFTSVVMRNTRHSVAALETAREVATHQATHDLLTGLPNRMHMRAILARTLASRADDVPVYVALVDLDRFKELNDSFGHIAGDDALRLIAGPIRQALPDDIAVGRIGGDEFEIIADGIEEATFVAACEALMRSLREPVRLSNGAEALIDCSIGYGVAPEHGTEAADLVRVADAAMFTAKREGRGHLARYNDALATEAARRRLIETDLRKAIAQHALTVVYQPQVSADGTRVLGVETLCRWLHPTLGHVRPDVFIPIAEETGFIAELGIYTLRQAMIDLIDLPDVKVAVNVSAFELRAPGYIDSVTDLLIETGFPPSRLELELTETALIGDEAHAASQITGLRALGMSLALDDFGTGYSSLAYLRRFAFDKVKIDKSFVTDVGASANAATIVHSVVSMSRAMGMSVTAEGVETGEQYRFLQAAGVTHMQGYLFSRPLAIGELGRFIGERSKAAA